MEVTDDEKIALMAEKIQSYCEKRKDCFGCVFNDCEKYCRIAYRIPEWWDVDYFIECTRKKLHFRGNEEVME